MSIVSWARQPLKCIVLVPPRSSHARDGPSFREGGSNVESDAAAFEAFSPKSAELEEAICSGQSCESPWPAATSVGSSTGPDRADDDKEAPREQLKEMVAAHQKHLQHDKAARVRTYRLADKELGASSHAISEQILKDRQGLREIPAMSWHGVPQQHVNMLCANFDPVKLPSVTDKQGQQKLFGAEVFAARDLEAAWDRRHALIPRTSWKTPAERQAAMPCFNANFCACKNNG